MHELPWVMNRISMRVGKRKYVRKWIADSEDEGVLDEMAG